MLVGLMSAQNCFGEFMPEFIQAYKLHEKWVFTYEAKRIAVKYDNQGFDPESGRLQETFVDPNVSYDDKIEKLSKNLNESIESIKTDKAATFESAVSVISYCSTRMMGTLVLVVDQAWPTKRKEVRQLLMQEIKKRGPEGHIYANLVGGYLWADKNGFSYSKRTLQEILDDKNTEQ